MIDSLWSDALKAFFPKGKDDPDLALIEFRLRTVEYWDGPGTLFGQAITFVVAASPATMTPWGENLIVAGREGVHADDMGLAVAGVVGRAALSRAGVAGMIEQARNGRRRAARTGRCRKR